MAESPIAKKEKRLPKKVFAIGACAIAGVTGVFMNSQKNTGASSNDRAITSHVDALTPTTSVEATHATQRESEISPEIQKLVKQASVQLVTRVKNGSGRWFAPKGSASVVELDNKKYVLAAGHEFDAYARFATGTEPPKNIADDEGEYEYGIITPGSDANVDGVLGIADKIVVSRDKTQDLALVSIKEPSDKFDAIQGLKLSEKTPHVGQKVVFSCGGEATNYAPGTFIAEVLSGDMVAGDRKTYAIGSETEDIFGLGFSGCNGMTSDGIMTGPLSSSLEQVGGGYSGAFTAVTPQTLKPYTEILK